MTQSTVTAIKPTATLLKSMLVPTEADLIEMNELYDGQLASFERAIFSAAEHYIEDYDGGQWLMQFWLAADGTKFMLWEPPKNDGSELLTLNTDSGHGAIYTTDKAASWALTGLVANHAAWAYSDMDRMDIAQAMNAQWEAIQSTYHDTASGLSEAEKGAVWTFLD